MVCILLGATLDSQGHRDVHCNTRTFEHTVLLINTLPILTFRAVAHASLSRLQEIHKEFAAVPDGDGYPKQAAVLGAPKGDLPGRTGCEPLALPGNRQGFRLQRQPHRSLRPAFIHLGMHTKETNRSKRGRTPWRIVKTRDFQCGDLRGSVKRLRRWGWKYLLNWESWHCKDKILKKHKNWIPKYFPVFFCMKKMKACKQARSLPWEAHLDPHQLPAPTCASTVAEESKGWHETWGPPWSRTSLCSEHPTPAPSSKAATASVSLS